MEYFRNHRAAYIRKIKDAIYTFLNLYSNKLNKFTSPEEVKRWKESERVQQAKNKLCNRLDDDDPDSPYIIEVILQKTFNEEELQNKDNVIFGITVILMFLDPTYDQAEISSSKVQERMNQWESDPIIRKWVSCYFIDLNVLDLLIGIVNFSLNVRNYQRITQIMMV